MRRHLAVLMGALALVGCGDDPQPAATPAPTANPTAPAEVATPAPPGSGANAFIGSIAVDPADGTLFLGTGLGLFRVEGKKQKRVVGELSTPDGSGRLSSNLVVRFKGPGELLASGHPEGAGSLPENLGLIRSRDGGRTWEPISELGESDFHILQASGDRVLGVRAEETDIQISSDGGRSFDARTPPATPVDVVADPEAPSRLVMSTEQGIFTSSDEGRSWRQREAGAAAQLTWADAVYRADPGGLIKASADGGQTWEDRGTVDSSVNELAADEDGALYASVAGGEVMRSSDGGATWRRYVRLR